MYIIEHDGIRAEAENERAAKRLLKKLRAEAQRKEDEETAARKAAWAECRSNGYRVLFRYVEGRNTEVTAADDVGLHRWKTPTEPYHKVLCVWTDNGDGCVSFHEECTPAIHSWCVSASGFPLAMLATFCGTDSPRWYAIGAAGGVLVYDPLPDAFQPAPAPAPAEALEV